MSRSSSRAIVLHNNRLLVMFRNKFGSKYVTLPGGAVELNESLENCALRELMEETTVSAENPRLMFIDHADFYGDQYIYLCDYVSGEPHLSENTHEFEINKQGKNLYEPGWLSLDHLPSVSFVSPELQSAILTALSSGWPQIPTEFTSKRTVQ